MANPYRLSRNVAPIAYDIDIVPDFAKFTFEGKESVHVTILKSARTVTLHAVELEILSADFIDAHDKKIASSHVAYDEAMETATVTFPVELPKGEGNLTLAFRGKINDKLRGFYRVKYTVDGVERYGGATQFESTDARRAFPCFDEPDFKAAFSLALTVSSHYTARSNMGEKEGVTLDHDRKKVVFLPTPVMSTYLLAWVIADLESIATVADCRTSKDEKAVTVTALTRPGKLEAARFGLDFGAHMLEFFTKYFDIHYPVEKLDLISLPDFSAGAMENLGAVTFRETAFHVDPKNSSVAARERVADVVAHEEAHMWFGDLVTMAWWDGLWLNESFASWAGPTAVHALMPDWEMWTRFFIEETLPALDEDAREHTHPVEMPVENPAEITEIFDTITYNKGASVLRMLADWLGEADMKKGLHAYLTRYAYRNTVTNDLWQALEEVSGKPVKAIMTGFTQQANYPLLTVQREGDALLIQQSPFLLKGGHSISRIWKIPITIKLQSGEEIKTLVEETSLRVPLPPAARGWIKVNFGQSTFCRVAYDREMRQALCDAIIKRELPPVDRLGFLDDALALARAGHLKTSEMLEILESYRDDDDYFVWEVVSYALSSIDQLIGEEDFHDRFDRFARDLYLPHTKRLGWEAKEGEHHLTQKFRALVLHGAGHHGALEIIERAKKEFAAHLETETLDPNLRRLVYGLHAKHGGEAAYESLRALHAKSDLSEEKMRILGAMGNVRDDALLGRYLEFAFSKHVRAQDAPASLLTSSLHHKGRKVAWEFIKKNWDMLVERYGADRLLGRAIHGVSRFHDNESLADVRDFFAAHPAPVVKRKMTQIMEEIEINTAWLARDREDIRDWLTAKS